MTRLFVVVITLLVTPGFAQNTLRLIPESVPNDRIRVYHINRTVSGTSIASITRGNRAYDTAIGPIGRAIAGELLAVDGVTEVTLRPYSVSIEIAEAFEWTEVEGKVLATLRRIASRIQPRPAVTGSPVAIRPNIKVEKAPNPYYRSYHTRYVLSKTDIQIWEAPFTTHNGELGDDYASLGQTGRRVVRQILAIDGVERIYIRPYMISVSIGQAYPWASIETQIIEILRRVAPQSPNLLALRP